jgi:hypothetical protein
MEPTLNSRFGWVVAVLVGLVAAGVGCGNQVVTSSDQVCDTSAPPECLTEFNQFQSQCQGAAEEGALQALLTCVANLEYNLYPTPTLCEPQLQAVQQQCGGGSADAATPTADGAH